MKFKKWFLGILIVIVAIIFFIGFFFWLQYEKLKPDYTENHGLPGLKDTVTVYIDSTGVYHLKAKNEEDLIKSMGYCVASERLWQMEMARRAGLGKLSEVFGDTTLKLDRFFRTLDFASLIKRLYKNASPESKMWMQWYTDGINEYIKENLKNLPIEFQLLRFKPSLWRPEEAFLVQRIMAWILNYNWKTDYLYWAIQQKVSPAHFKDILPEWREYPTIIKLTESEKVLFQKLWDLDGKLRDILNFPASNWGSNSWVISGSRTKTGKPILANDPHLELTLPSIWFEMVLECPQFRVAGFTIPGAPGIVIGRNNYIAWGLTNGMIDDSDYFIEQVDTSLEVFKQDNKKMKLKIFEVEIRSKEKPVRFKSYWTNHGPILNTVFEKMKTTRFLSLKWTAWENSDEVRTFYLLARAHNWKEFREALSYFKSPSQNFIYADREGNIGYQLAGAVPIRPDNQGLLPRDGSSSADDWEGFIPFSKLPHIFNPHRGWIVTANNKIIDNYPYYLSEVWEPPFRAMRIEELIRDKSSPVSVRDVQKIQMDIRSSLSWDLGIELKELLEKNRDSIKRRGIPNYSEILTVLDGWNGNFSATAVAPSIIESWQWFLIRNIFKDEMGENLFELFVDVPNFYQRIFYQIFKKKNSPWYYKVDTPELETRKDILFSSFIDAIHFLQKEAGDKPYQWEWGKLHTLYLKHSLGGVFLLKQLFNRGPFPLPGNGTTVNVATYKFKNPFGVVAGPSMRMVVDFGHPDIYESIFPGGNSGNVFSEFYDNQIQNWISGKLRKINLLDIANISKYKFLLLPMK